MGVFWRRSFLEILLGSSDVDGSLQLLLAVVVVVHQFAVPQYKPAHLPVSEVEHNENKGRVTYSRHFKCVCYSMNDTYWTPFLSRIQSELSSLYRIPLAY